MTPTARRRSLAELWSAEVVDAEYGGHPGLMYADRPRSAGEMLTGIDRWATRECLVFANRRYDYATFARAITTAAGVLHDRGVRSGDRVMIMAYNSPELILAVWAAWRLGAVPVMANRWWSATDTQTAVQLTTPVLLLTDHPEIERFTTTMVCDLAVLEPAWLGDPAATDVAEPDVDEESEALVVFTSGSTGYPKAVVLSHRAIVANQQNLLVRGRRLPADRDMSADQDVTLVCTPLFHVGGISTMINTALIGNRLVLAHGKFDPAQVMHLIERERVTTWGGVPTMAARVLEHPDIDAYDLSSLRSMPVGGAPLPPTLHARMTRKIPQLARRGLGNTWGMTESGGFVTSAGNADLIAHPGTVGRAFAVAEVRVESADEHGVGEILLRTPSMMSGYLGDASSPIDADGWLHTGDLGRLEDGLLFVEGRSKDVIIRGGENIAAGHVEDAILTHPDVLEAVVVGMPHPDLGEEVVAVVVTRPGTILTESALDQHVRPQVAYFEVPARWVMRHEALPTLPGEKTDKKAVKESLTT